MSDEFIRREDAIETAMSAFNAWNLAMAAADGQREINLVFRRKELCKAVELVFRGAPAADVAEVVHGEWLRADDDWNSLTTIQCSLCSEEWCFETDDDVSLLNYKYCPNCGARMDGENEKKPVRESGQAAAQGR